MHASTRYYYALKKTHQAVAREPERRVGGVALEAEDGQHGGVVEALERAVHQSEHARDQRRAELVAVALHDQAKELHRVRCVQQAVDGVVEVLVGPEQPHLLQERGEEHGVARRLHRLQLHQLLLRQLLAVPV